MGILEPKKIWFKRNFVSEIDFGSKKCLVQKNVGSEKNLCLKKMLGLKKFSPKTNLSLRVQKKSWVEKIYLLSKNNFKTVWYS